MDKEHKRKAGALIKTVVLLQFKVLLGAARDLVVGPTALVAALVDLVLLKQQEPNFFPAVLRFGEQTDRWIDTWSAGRHPAEAPRENVDMLIARVEEVGRDPQAGARHARVLKRWAERQVKRARQRAAVQLSRPGASLEATTTPPNEPK